MYVCMYVCMYIYIYIYIYRNPKSPNCLASGASNPKALEPKAYKL